MRAHQIGMLFVRAILVIVTAALLAWALPAATASGAAAVAPPDGAQVDGTPTFKWAPGPGDEADQLELSPSRALADDGSFVDDPGKRTFQLSSAQTSFTVPGSQPLLAGTWYWHVQLSNFDVAACCTVWTDVRRVVVRDAPIQLRSFKLGFLRALDDIVLRIGYSDNSTNLAARYRLSFRARRRGRRLATVSGKLDRASFQGDVAVDEVRRPGRLRRGRRYFARLELRDAAGHVTRSGYARFRL
jgi:hypothetical protein